MVEPGALVEHIPAAGRAAFAVKRERTIYTADQVSIPTDVFAGDR